MKSNMNPTLLKEPYASLVQHYEACFERHGPIPQGVDWPNPEDALLRHQIMQGLWSERPSTSLKVIDIGCGYGGFLDYLKSTQASESLDYTGIDLSFKMIEEARKRHPEASFAVRDILKDPLKDNLYDYGLMNGVLTEKLDLSFEDMEAFAHEMILNLFRVCRHGIAFNVMSSHVDWERDDLFHMPYDRLADFLTTQCSRHFLIRSDYGLYEYTVYLYHHPFRERECHAN